LLIGRLGFGAASIISQKGAVSRDAFEQVRKDADRLERKSQFIGEVELASGKVDNALVEGVVELREQYKKKLTSRG
jgi:hypothetical protein